MSIDVQVQVLSGASKQKPRIYANLCIDTRFLLFLKQCSAAVPCFRLCCRHRTNPLICDIIRMLAAEFVQYAQHILCDSVIRIIDFRLLIWYNHIIKFRLEDIP